MTIKLGCNAGIYADVQAAVPGIVTSRSYRDDGTIPTVWPIAAGAACSTASLRPDLDALLNDTPVADNGSGATTLYGQIAYLAQHAPVGSKLTIWHEAGNLYGGNPQITPQKIRQSHVRCWNACRGTYADYGVIIYGTITDMDKWIPGYPHSQGVPGALAYPMDWYGIDPYDNLGSNNGSDFRDFEGNISQDKVNGYMGMYRTLAQGRTGLDYPQIDVNECNSPIPANRGNFFMYLAEWLHNNGGHRLQVFYKDGGSSGGPWDPADANTIAALNAIVTSYGT